MYSKKSVFLNSEKLCISKKYITFMPFVALSDTLLSWFNQKMFVIVSILEKEWGHPDTFIISKYLLNSSYMLFQELAVRRQT